jgi:hypothetical protein
MPVKRRAAKAHIPQPPTWDTLTPGERAFVLGKPLPAEPYGEQWGFGDAAARDLWRPGRPTARELIELFKT